MVGQRLEKTATYLKSVNGGIINIIQRYDNGIVVDQFGQTIENLEDHPINIFVGMTLTSGNKEVYNFIQIREGAAKATIQFNPTHYYNIAGIPIVGKVPNYVDNLPLPNQVPNRYYIVSNVTARYVTYNMPIRRTDLLVPENVHYLKLNNGEKFSYCYGLAIYNYMPQARF